MAVNIVDAFVVTWGMDVSNHQRGEVAVREGQKRLREESVKTFNTVENTGKRLGMSLRSVRNEIAGLLLVFTGGRSLLDFASGMLKGEAAASRMSETIGVATSKIMAWQQAVKTVGGQGGEADSALQAIATAIQSYKLTGTTGMDADLMGLGINRSDLMSKDPSEILMKIAEAGERMSKVEFAARLQRIGMPQSMIYLLEQGRKGLEGQVRELEKHANVTKEDEEAARRFQQRWAELETVISGKVRPALTWLVEQLLKVLDALDRNGALMPIVTGAVIALGGAALGALGPWGRFAGAIAAVVIALDELVKRNPKVREFLDWIEAPLKALLPKEWQWIFDRPGAAPSSGAPSAEGAAGANPGGAPMSAGARANDAYIRNRLLQAGIKPEVVSGIVAGLYAESRLDPTIKNPKSGAYGISQWLGSRKKALFARYGNSPTLAQQVEYLISELKGGDAGGARVLQQVTPDHALLSFVTSFLRPQGRNWEHRKDWEADIRRGRQYLFGKGSSRTSSSTTTIGKIEVHTQATDAAGTGRAVAGALGKRGIIVQTDAGIAP